MRRRLNNYSSTIFILVVLIFTYGGQLFLAGSFRSGAGYDVATSFSQSTYLLLNPWLHSTHRHLVENALMFGVLGVWTERRTNSLQFGAFVVATGYVTNLAPPVLGIGGFGVGISGVTNALMAYFVAAQLVAYHDTVQMENLDYKRVALHLVFAFIGLIFVFRSVAEFTGYITPPPGTATGAHLLGVVLGFTWIAYRLSTEG